MRRWGSGARSPHPTDLIAEARATGLTVEVDGDRLVIRGPKEHGELARAILAAKARVLAVLAEEAEAAVAWRVAVMAPQIPTTGTIPFLVARSCQTGPADCLSCGDPMEAGQRYVCRPCAEAAQGVVAADEAARATRRTKGDQL
ncbi:MAG: hypothetical protein AVDCRST_MAG49-543 [uncultured Thermomicrobiales bacterium]|uniref:TubC N-terminal docking domain-containing protein n=1 Tax=uncultured Thermomicrobiales bacterium TaxID=1645740 RepID=A0A6J4U4J5_9BACT|nr:MAG: hypothetical protein AVDCRST_MAG49-543 [uncultured Thermomicrobiales bacterium]